MLSCRLWAGVAVSVLLCGCLRAGFYDPGKKPSDSAVETSWREGGVADHGVVEADMQQSCAPGVPLHSWSRGAGTTGKDYGVSVAIDASGNVYLTGAFTGKINLGGQDFTSTGDASDIFLASYTDKGVHRWSRQFGGMGRDSGEYLQVDASGNIYLTGEFSGTADFGGGLMASKGIDAFVASFTGAGVHRWSRGYGGTSTDSGAGVAVDGSGNVYLIGSFRVSAAFGGGDLTSKGKADTFVASFSPDGAHRWSKPLGGVGEDYGSAIAVDPGGNVTATGRFFGSVDFNGTTITSKGQDDIYIVSYTGTGSPRWRKRMGGLGQDVPFDLVADGGGNVFVTGRFQETVDFGGSSVSSNGGSDIFIASYSNKGVLRWSRGIGGAQDDAGRRLAVDGGGNVFLAAMFQGTADPGGGPLTSNGGGDVLAASYTGLGQPCWQLSFGDADDEAGYGVAVQGSGQLVLAGWFYDTLSLGGQTQNSVGGMDIFVAGFTR
jgi:hypothetical protein